MALGVSPKVRKITGVMGVASAQVRRGKFSHFSPSEVHAKKSWGRRGLRLTYNSASAMVVLSPGCLVRYIFCEEERGARVKGKGAVVWRVWGLC